MDAPPAVSALRVLTINTHRGYTALNRRFVLPEMRDAIRAVGADLVFLQEVQGDDASGVLAGGSVTAAQHEFLADTLWPQFAYGRNAVYPHGHHGNAVLSKYPIVHSENRDVSVGRHEQRGLLHCVLAVPGVRLGLHAVCVHLGLLEAHRLWQVGRLCDLVGEDVPPEAPLVVAGDFNDWRHRAHRVLVRRTGLVEVFQRVLGRSPRTFPARWPMLALDRIYVRNARALSPLMLPRRPWSHLSDHVPLAAELRL